MGCIPYERSERLRADVNTAIVAVCPKDASPSDLPNIVIWCDCQAITSISEAGVYYIQRPKNTVRRLEKGSKRVLRVRIFPNQLTEYDAKTTVCVSIDELNM